MTKQAVPLSGCPFLHFKGWLGSAVLPVGAAHSIIFGSGGEMRFGVSTHHSPSHLIHHTKKEEPITMTQMDGQCTTNFVCLCLVVCKQRRGAPCRPGGHWCHVRGGLAGAALWSYPAPPATYIAFIFRLLLKIAVS